MTVREKYRIYDDGYYECVKDLLENDLVLMMDSYIQHGFTTTLSHCITVSYNSYKIAKKLNLNYVAAARAGLLHDFYLYDWHMLEKEKNLFKKHGYVHAAKALENAKENFEISKLEEDIISKHMWPLTLRKVPRHRESFIVSVVDKCSSTKETVYPYFKIIRKYV